MRQIRQTAKDIPEIIDADVDSFALLSKYSDVCTKVEMQNIRNPRASSLYDACMRMHVIGASLNLKQKRFLNVHSRITFGIGDSLHYQVQNTDLIFDKHKRIGWWKCKACSKIRQFGRQKVVACEFCNAQPEATTYHEHSLSVHKNPVLVTGHPDLFILISKGVIRIVEIKSIKKEAYENLVMPLISHQWQIITYLMYCNKSTTKLPVKIDESLGYVLYVSKEQTGRDLLPVRLYPIKNDLIINKQIKDKLRLYYNGIKNWPKNTPSALTECSNSKFKCYRAKYCPTLNYCTKGD